MKLLILIISTAIFLNLNSCAKRELKAYDAGKVIAKMNPIHSFSTMNSVGFEWKEISDKRVGGIYVYKGTTSQKMNEFTRIKTINNRYATRFVDTFVAPDHNYSYAFSVFSEGEESALSPRLEIKMSASLDAVSLIEAKKLDSHVIKISWIVHENTSISSYILERRINGGAWRFLSMVQGRLMSEYIDTFIQEGHSYEYRIIARSYAKIRAYPSEVSYELKIPILKK